MVDDARASLLATLASDRERRQQLDTAPDSTAKRKQERDALIERLLQERRERQERQQPPPPSAADGAAPAAPRAAPPRMAWEENLDRNELRLEHELGLPSTHARAARGDAAADSDTASLSDLPPPHYPEAYLDGRSFVPDEPGGDLPEVQSSLSLSLDGLGHHGDGGEADEKGDAGEEDEAGPGEGAVEGRPDGSSLEEVIARADAVMEGYYAERERSPGRRVPVPGQSARVPEPRDRMHGFGSVDPGSMGSMIHGSTDRGVQPREVDALPLPSLPSPHAPPDPPPEGPPSHTAAATAAAAVTRTPATKMCRGVAMDGREGGAGGGPAGACGRPKLEADAPPSFQPSINPRSAALASARQGDCYSRLSSQVRCGCMWMHVDACGCMRMQPLLHAWGCRARPNLSLPLTST